MSGERNAGEARDAFLRACLLDVTAAISGSVSIDEVTHTLVVEARNALDAKTGALWLARSSERVVRMVASVGYPGDLDFRMSRLPRAAPIPLIDAINRGEPVWVESRAEYAVLYPEAESRSRNLEQFRTLSFACVPLAIDDEWLAAFSIGFDVDRAIDEAERAFLIVLARHTALALRRALSFEKEKLARVRATILQNVATALCGAVTPLDVARVVIAQAIDMLSVTSGALWIEVPENSEVIECVYSAGPRDAPSLRGQRRARSDDTAFCDAIRTGEPRVSGGDGDQGEVGESLFAVPIRVGGRVTGSLVFHFADVPGDACDPTILRALGDQCSIAFERAALLERERALRLEAELANRLRDDFLATVSHELRTPLNAIKGWVRMLKMGALPAERKLHALDVIERNTDAQTRLISDLLDVSRIIAGKLRLNVATLDLRAVLSSAVDSVRPLAEQRTIEIALSEPADPVIVKGDAERLEQVVWNLLTNALKFSRAGQKIEVTLEHVGDAATITVRDHGEGISLDFLPHVFERFRQADATFARRHGGLGLGLAIARSIVQMHRGAITAHSDGDGRGSTFAVRLPRTPDERTRASDAVAASPPSASQRLDGIRVLVVEDDADSRDMLVAMIEQRGALVVGRGSARDAHALLETFAPDVLISDLGMPDQDGFTMIREIRQRGDAAIARTPAIALTAYVRDEDRERALEAGFDMHLLKPVNASELWAAIERLASRGKRATADSV